MKDLFSRIAAVAVLVEQAAKAVQEFSKFVEQLAEWLSKRCG